MVHGQALPLLFKQRQRYLNIRNTADASQRHATYGANLPLQWAWITSWQCQSDYNHHCTSSCRGKQCSASFTQKRKDKEKTTPFGSFDENPSIIPGCSDPLHTAFKKYCVPDVSSVLCRCPSDLDLSLGHLLTNDPSQSTLPPRPPPSSLPLILRYQMRQLEGTDESG